MGDHRGISVHVCLLPGRLHPHCFRRSGWARHQEKHLPQRSPLWCLPLHPRLVLHHHQVLLSILRGQEEPGCVRQPHHAHLGQPDPSREPANEPKRNGLLETDLLQADEQLACFEEPQGGCR